MILLSSKKAERAIAENSFSSTTKYRYLLFTYLALGISGPIYLITPTFGGFNPTFMPLMFFLTWFLHFFFTYRGIKKCYWINISIDDSNFIERFTILNIPILIKFLIILLPVSLLMTWGYHWLGFTYNSKTTGHQIFFGLLTPFTTYIYFYFMGRSFKRLSYEIKV